MKLFKRLAMLCLTLALLVTPVLSMNLEAAALVNGAGAPTDLTYYSLGIDISEHQTGGGSDAGYVDFAALEASGCEYVILRAHNGGGRYDYAFKNLYDKARATSNMKLGVYMFTYATTRAQAEAEAQMLIDYFEANDMYFEYPIWYDIENQDTQFVLSSANKVELCLGWCETLEKAGYYPGIYSGLGFFNDLPASFKYDKWIAHYGSMSSTGNYTHTDIAFQQSAQYNAQGYSIWQYSFWNLIGETGQYIFQGINTYSGGSTPVQQLDMDVCYKNYPAIMAENGYNNCAPENAAKKALRDAIDGVGDIKCTDYSDAALEEIRAAIANANSVLNNSSSTDDQYTAAATRLNKAVANKAVALSAGKPYTVSEQLREDSFADDGIKLTDGNKGWLDGGTIASAGWQKKAEITVDLGSAVSSDSYTAYISAGAWGIYLPKPKYFTVEAYGSNSADGEFVSIGSTNTFKLLSGSNVYDESWSIYSATVTADSVQNYRYIKFVLTNSECAGHIFIDEVEVTLGAPSVVGGVYVNGINEYIESGDCHIFTPSFGTITVDTANHAFTMNVVAKYNSELGKYVVKSTAMGVGLETAAISLASDEILISAHSWEESDGATADNIVEGSYINRFYAYMAKVGDVIDMSGIDIATGTCSAGSYIRFRGATVRPEDEECVHMGSANEATCTEDKTCDACKAVLEPATGHDEGEWVTLDDGTKVLQCTICGETIEEGETWLRGDVNLDGKVDMFDYLIIKNIYFKKHTPDEGQAKRADLNEDGNIDVFDYMEVKMLCF